MRARCRKPAARDLTSGTGWAALFDLQHDDQGRAVSGIAMPVVLFGYRWSSYGEESVAVFISGEYGIVDVAEEDAFAGVVPVTAIPEQYRYRAIVAEDGGTPADPTSATTA